MKEICLYYCANCDTVRVFNGKLREGETDRQLQCFSYDCKGEFRTHFPVALAAHGPDSKYFHRFITI